jgi:hypothetical protein
MLRSLCLLPAFILLVALSPASASSGSSANGAHCIRIEQITAFAPRGEVYVQLGANCQKADFGGEKSIVAHLEVHTGDAATFIEDFRIYSDEPQGSRTIAFEGLELKSGDPLLVRLIRFGRILALQTVLVP